MNDRLVVLAVVFFLGLVSAGTLIGAIVLRLNGQDPPGEMWGFGGVALGAIAGLLAATSTKPPAPAPNPPPENPAPNPPVGG
jgi:hypothetical protein